MSATDAGALTARGITECRGCGATTLVSVLDLGDQALSNEMVLDPTAPAADFPLHLRICSGCGLGQVGEFVLPDRIFAAEYPYQSSMSTSWVAHAGRYASEVATRFGIGEGTFVVEIASNDGYLLTQIQDQGARVLGVEPAAGVAALARAKGVPTVEEFFGVETARRVLAEHGHPDLIAANNVMAHVPDLIDFVAGLATLCDQDTVISVENPSLEHLLDDGLFDTIYHEHFSYLSAHAVAIVARRAGLELWDVEELPTHGGSNRYWLAPAGAREVTPRVADLIQRELAGGLIDPAHWSDFAARSRAAIDGLRSWLGDQSNAGRTVAGYGAAAKGNTILNAVGAEAGTITLVVDASPEKQGKYLPGSRVPVGAPAALASASPDSVVILPWNIAEELAVLIASLTPDAEVWTAVPQMRRLR